MIRPLAACLVLLSLSACGVDGPPVPPGARPGTPPAERTGPWSVPPTGLPTGGTTVAISGQVRAGVSGGS